MTSNENSSQGRALNLEMNWLRQVIMYRLKQWKGVDVGDVEFPQPPELVEDTPYRKLLGEYNFQTEERLLLTLGLAPHIRPDILEALMGKNPGTDMVPALFGGLRMQGSSIFYPTGDTYLFIMAGTDLEDRMPLYRLFDFEHWLSTSGILELDEPESGESLWSLPVSLSREILDLCLYGRSSIPRYSSTFPAQLIATKYDWEDLVVNSKTREQLREIEVWVKQKEQLMLDQNLKRLLQPGFRALFYGPPGTGKSLTGSLLGKSTGKMVFRIDLSQLVSKYIGETEKNLSRIFDRAENKDWILFFDEADSLFGKRTSVKDSHDRYANQGVSYLLQRIEHFNGLAILATNLKSNIDSAFMRRMQAVVHFPVPGPEERLILWKNSFPSNAGLSKELSIERLAQNHEISGGSIANVVQYCALRVLDRGDQTIMPEDVLEGLKREFQKLGRVL